jgi:hypothetical protein
MPLQKDRREDAIQSYRRWLEEFRWDLYCTLKITSGIPSDRRALALFKRWIAAVEELDGGSRFRWVRVLEKGGGGCNRHFHVLVGGLRNRCRFWERQWNELGGNAVITPFNPSERGILYVLKTTDEKGDLDIEFQLPRSAKRRLGKGTVNRVE